MRYPVFLIFVATGVAFSAVPNQAATTSDPVDRFGEWIDLERAIASRHSDWRTEKQALEAEIRLLEAELRRLDLAIEDARQSRDRRRAEADAITAANARTRNELAAFEAAIPRFQETLRSFLPQLPPETASTIRPLLKRSQRPGLSLPDRFNEIAAATLRIAEAAQGVRVTTGLREMPDGDIREVEILYLGLAAAWFVDSTATRAGTGSPGPEGWIWARDDSIAPAVARAVRIAREIDQPSVVELPLR